MKHKCYHRKCEEVVIHPKKVGGVWLCEKHRTEHDDWKKLLRDLEK